MCGAITQLYHLVVLNPISKRKAILMKKFADIPAKKAQTGAS
jgi:hypothetical protein